MGERLELYKVMIATITAAEQRRQQVTTVNISLVVAGMTALGGIKGLDPIYIALPALPLAVIWLSSIRFFRRVAKAKWEVVGELEREFEAQPFGDEWRTVKDKLDVMPFGLTHLEMFIPAAIITASTLYLIFRAACLAI